MLRQNFSKFQKQESFICSLTYTVHSITTMLVLLQANKPKISQIGFHKLSFHQPMVLTLPLLTSFVSWILKDKWNEGDLLHWWQQSQDCLERLNQKQIPQYFCRALRIWHICVLWEMLNTFTNNNLIWKKYYWALWNDEMKVRNTFFFLFSL